MRKRVTILVLVLVSLALVVVLVRPPDDGPVYRGQTLYHWLDIETKTNTDLVKVEQAEEAYKAVMQIGTNALPWLVAQIRNAPGHWRYKVGGKISNLPYPVNVTLSRMMPGNETEYREGLAIEGFSLLGTNAVPALPELCKIMNETNSFAPSRAATIALGHLGREALPPIIAVLTNAGHPQRRIAAGLIGSTMWYLETNAISAVPALTQCANDPDPRVAQEARSSLKAISGGEGDRTTEIH